MVQIQTNLELEILLHLARGKDHLRQIARATSTPHATVFRSLIRLLDENVLDSSVSGRNKVFSIRKNLQAKAYLAMAEQYKLRKTLAKYPKLGIILSDLLASTDAPLIVLFGSFAKFSAKEGSDIDVYVDTEEPALRRKLEAIHSDLGVKTGPFDLNSVLIKEIVKNHVILRGEDRFYEKTGFFA
ncbi:MAG: nucleotidyltransferase domain-containing protein [Candidatus Micrarchaeota archaeon]